MIKSVIKDFPKEGVNFLDITKCFTDKESREEFVSKINNMDLSKYDAVVAIESRGFVVGSYIAALHYKPLILVRKEGKLPTETVKIGTTSEYGSQVLEISVEDLKELKKKNVLVVDDVVATGATMRSVIKTLEDNKIKADGMSVFLIEGFTAPEDYELEVLFP